MASADHSLYVRKSDRGIVIIVIYVDDLIVGGDKLDEIEHVKGLLKLKFDMKDLGDLRYFWALRSFAHLMGFGCRIETICCGYAVKVWYG